MRKTWRRSIYFAYCDEKVYLLLCQEADHLERQEKRSTVPFELISLHNVTTIERLVNGRVILPMRKQQSIRISNDVILLITHRVGTSNFLKTKKMRIKRTSFFSVCSGKNVKWRKIDW